MIELVCHPEQGEGSPSAARNSSTSPQDDKKILSVSTLSLHHFRNYSSARVEVGVKPVVITGHNGAGKTNILEALSLLTPGRGLRKAKLSELDSITPSPLKGEGRDGAALHTPAPKNAPTPTLPPQGGGGYRNWVVAATAIGMRGEVQIGTGRDPEADGIDKRILRIDGKSNRAQSELARHLSMIWLTPQMEQLFNDGASAGRKFLDRLVYSFDPDHASRTNEYEYAMRERNKLLQNPYADSGWLDALEQTMAETGAAIAQARLLACEHINHAVIASPLSFPKAHITIQGTVEDWLKVETTSLQVEEDFKAILNSSRRIDAAAGRTLAGIHRSELLVTHTEKNMPAQNCSTGEQKAMLLSIVLAQARSGAQYHNVVPILLLDEVVAHLDENRRRELFEEILDIGAQVWLTGTDSSLFSGIISGAYQLKIANGKIL